MSILQSFISIINGSSNGNDVNAKQSTTKLLIEKQQSNLSMIRCALKSVLDDTNACFKEIYLEEMGKRRFAQLELPPSIKEAKIPKPDITNNDETPEDYAKAMVAHRVAKTERACKKIEALLKTNDVLFAAIQRDVYDQSFTVGPGGESDQFVPDLKEKSESDQSSTVGPDLKGKSGQSTELDAPLEAAFEKTFSMMIKIKARLSHIHDLSQ